MLAPCAARSKTWMFCKTLDAEPLRLRTDIFHGMLAMLTSSCI